MQNVDYGTMPIKKLMIRLAIPSIIKMIVSSINMIVDGMFMGKFIGSDSLAAVNLVIPIIIVIFGLVDMIASGSGIRIGVLLGEGNKKEASRTFSASTVLIFSVSLVLTICSFIFADDIIYYFIKDTSLRKLAYDYAKIFIPAIIFIAPHYTFDNFLRICGKTHKSMWINVFVSVLNIILNSILVGYLGLGISYAALSTVISMIVGSILSIIPFIKNKMILKFTKPLIPFKDLKMIIYNGSSEFFENISGAFMIVLANSIMMSVAGAAGVAAMSVISYIEMLLMPIIQGIISSVKPLVSFNHGAKNHERLTKTFKLVCITTAIISTISLILMMMFPNFLVSLFSSKNDLKMREIATTGLMLYAPSYLFTWLNMTVGTFLTSFEKPTESVILMSLESVVFPIIFFIILSRALGTNGMFLAQTLAALSTSLVAIFMWKKTNSKLIKHK